ncbi:unnamed protein product [Euphydryas editha]|uniref:Uncharacterized protein n=1 Tax=Euphydryas editha TaxID=104508 RepID=A0AAU9V164_EUPED|nr:unnamed protein product [Euphydryas editha]
MMVAISTNNKNKIKLKIKGGLVFEQHSEEIQEAFKFAMVQYGNNMNKTRLDFQLFVDVINTADAFKLSRLKIQSATNILKKGSEYLRNRKKVIEWLPARALTGRNLATVSILCRFI